MDDSVGGEGIVVAGSCNVVINFYFFLSSPFSRCLGESDEIRAVYQTHTVLV